MSTDFYKGHDLKTVAGIMILLLLLAGVAGGATINNGKETKDLKLSGHKFDPSLKNGGDYKIVQFSGPITEEWKKWLEDNGAKIIGYIPENALLIKYHGVIIHPSIVQSGDFVQEYKINPLLSNRTGKITLNIISFEQNDSLISQISLLGGEVEQTGSKLRVTIEAPRIKDIASLENVEWVEEYVPPRLLNDVAAGIMGASTVWVDPGLNGTGQIVAIDDTGLDTGNLATVHNDFKGRIKAHFGYGRPSIGMDPTQTKMWDDTHGHGTHVSGSVLGNGSRSGGAIKGIAYNATLVIQSILDSSNGLGGLDVGIYPIYNDSYNEGARIQSNSWGAALNGLYGSDSVEVDTFAWDHKDFVILFAAGNEGVDSNSDGIVDLDSLSSPSTAKNVITVGASENYRPGFSSTYGISWPSDFPAVPIKTDRFADNSSGMVAFSSRGPTNDERIKPDVVAPGTWILSTKSSLGSNYWGTYNSYYAYNGGTSMSTPLTAGAATLVRQYYVNKGVYPSAALIKATLINTAKNMSGQYAFPKKDVTGQPDNNQGWGRVDLGRLTEDKIFVDNNTGINTGKFNVTNVKVDGYQTFEATLVWTDYPGAPYANKELVNDLDLIVTNPTGQQFYGNDFSVPYNSSYDSTNNVEGVMINNPVPGMYKVNVSARNVPMGGLQPFAIVVSGIDGNITVIANSTIYPDGQFAAKNSDMITLGATVTSIKGIQNVTVNATSINSSLAKVFLEKSFNDSYINSSVVVNATGGAYKINVTAYDNSSGKNNTTQLTVIVDNTLPLIFPNPVNYEMNGSAHNDSVIIINVTASDNLFVKNVSANVSTVNSSGTVELVNESGFWKYVLVVRGRDGNHTINMTVYDGALNINHTEFNITMDSSPPVITNITHNATGSLDAGNTVRVEMKGESGKSANFTIEGVVSNASMNEVMAGNYSANYTITGCKESYDVHLVGYLTDSAGNTNSSIASQGIYIDSCAPVITLQSPANNSVIHSGAVINLNVSDLNLNIVNYNINGDANISFSYPYNISTTSWPNGTYIIRVYANDTKQHSTGSLYVFTIDDSPPSSVKNLVNVSFSSNYINWSWIDPSDTDFIKVKVYLDGVYKNDIDKGLQYYNTTVSPGTYTVGTRTVDAIGNINSSIVTHTANTTLPPIRFINGTVIKSINKTGIPGVIVFANTSFSAYTNASGFYSIEVTEGIYDLLAVFEPMYYVNNTITVSTIGRFFVDQDIELVEKAKGTITGIVTN